MRQPPSDTKSSFVRRRHRSALSGTRRGGHGMVTSLRSAPASSSLAVQPDGWGSSRRPWGRGVRRAVCGEAGDVTAMKQVPAPHCCCAEGAPQGVSTVGTRVLGRRRVSRPVARILRGSASHSLRSSCEVAVWTGLLAEAGRSDGLVPPSRRVGWTRVKKCDGTVGLDPSRACVRPPLFTMLDHGWPPLPMTRP